MIPAAPVTPSAPLSADAQRDFLRGLVARAQETSARGGRPVVVFDLDGTLFDNRPRTLSILRELADTLGGTHPEITRAIMEIDAANLVYGITDSLARHGINDEGIWARAIAFWRSRFFRDEYLVHDVPLPGAAAFAEELWSAGATLLYLTGRDLPEMSVGSWVSLREHGFPIGRVGTELVCKPAFDLPDEEYKRDIAPRVARLGEPIASFDNEPANCNAFLRAYPAMSSVFLATQHAPSPPPLDAGVVTLRDFRS